MTSHERSILPIKQGASPIDEHTKFFAPFETHLRDIVEGYQPIMYDKISDFLPPYSIVETSLYLEDKPYTFCFWVFPTRGYGARSNLLSGFAAAHPNRWDIEWDLNDDEKIVFSPWEASSTARNTFSAGIVPQETWTHIAISHDYPRKIGTIYINGKTDRTFPIELPLQTGAPLVLGARTNTTTYTMAGSLQDVIVYDSILDETSVKQVMQKHPDMPMNMVGWWSLEPTGNIEADRTRHGHDGTRSSMGVRDGETTADLFNNGLCLETPTTNLMDQEDGAPTEMRREGINVKKVAMETPFGGTAWQLSIDETMAPGFSNTKTTSNRWIRSYDGSPYVVSLWVKGPESAFASSTFYHTGTKGMGTMSRTGRVVDGWQEMRASPNASSDGGTGSQYLAIFLNKTVTEKIDFYICGSQVEQWTFGTNYTPTHRPRPNVQYANPIPEATDCTVSFWFYPLQFTDTDTAILNIDPGEDKNGIWFDYKTDQVRGFIYNDVPAGRVCTMTGPLSGWTHVALTVEKGGMVTGYINGEKKIDTPIENDFFCRGLLTLGRRFSRHQNRIPNVILKHLRIDNIARSAVSIKSEYHHERYGIEDKGQV